MARPRRNNGAPGASIAIGIDVADSLLTALALVLVIEGLLPLFAPRIWRDSVRKIADLTDGQLRFVGLAAIFVGLIGYAWLVS